MRLEPSAELAVASVPVTPFQQNASVLACRRSGRAAIVDPGDDLDALLAAAADLGDAVEGGEVRVEKVLVTHGHLDHAGATAELAARLSVPVEGPHEEDRFWIESMEEQGRAFGMAGGRSFEPDRWLVDGDRVTVGELELEVLHCPGHTPGHVVFFHRPSNFAVVGDVLFQGSIGRSDFPRGHYGTLIRSIKERLLPLGDGVTFLPGHGPTSTFGAERTGNPFLLQPEAFGTL